MDADSLLQRADIAMFKAKRNGAGISGSYAFYSQDMDAHIAGNYFLSQAYARRFISKSFSWYINRRSTSSRALWLALRFCCVGSILSAV
jgi:GGDEF domain-containing protein